MKWLMPMMVMVSFQSFAMVTSSGKCPVEFEGVVKEIIPSVGPSHAYSTQRIIFTKLDESEDVQLDVLVNGPVSPERGVEYHVEMRNGKLCKIEQI